MPLGCSGSEPKYFAEFSQLVCKCRLTKGLSMKSSIVTLEWYLTIPVDRKLTEVHTLESVIFRIHLSE